MQRTAKEPRCHQTIRTVGTDLVGFPCFERPERPLLQANRIAYAGLCEFNQLSCDHCRQDVSPVNKPKRLQHVLKDGTQSGNLCGLKALLSFEKFGDWHTSAAQNYFIRTARVFRKDGVHGRTPLPLGHNRPASFDKAELPVCSKLTIFKFQTGVASLTKNMNIVPQPCSYFGIGKSGVRLNVQYFNDLGGCLTRGANAIPAARLEAR
jgi:hypothetical protein